MFYAPGSEIIVKSAAVADFKPANSADQKIKKDKTEGMSIDLVRTVDILSELGKIKKDNQVLVGFALETQDALEYARKKKANKNADMIVMNTPSESTGFGTDTNAVTLVADDEIELPLGTKKEIAEKIVMKILALRDARFSQTVETGFSMDGLIYNASLPAMEVRHQDLERVDGSPFRSKCPNCKDGVLFMRREAPKTHYLSTHDNCTFCGRTFIYPDLEEKKMVPVYKKESK
jgi:hypothetical protein